MPQVCLGNPTPLINNTAVYDPDAVTVLNIPDSRTLAEAIQDVVADGEGHLMGGWKAHSVVAAPSWVESTSPELAAALAAHYGCPVGRPAGHDTPLGAPAPMGA